MENQGKRLLLAVALALGVMMVWQVLFPPAAPKKKPPVPAGSGSAQVQPRGSGDPFFPDVPTGAGSGSGSAVAVGSGSGSGTGAAPTPAPPPVEAAPVAPRPPEQVKVFQFPHVRVETTTYGAAVKKYQLLDPKYDRDHDKGDLVAPEGRGALIVFFPQSTFVIDPAAAWTPHEIDQHTIQYTLDTPNLKISKTFTILAEDHLIRTEIEVTPIAGEGRQSLGIATFHYQDPKISTKHARGNTEWKAACLRDDDVKVASYKTLRDLPSGATENGVRWAGFAQGYVPGGRLTSAVGGQFLVATAPRLRDNELVACNSSSPAGALEGLMRVDLVFPPTVLRAGDPPVKKTLFTYLGPTRYEWLEAADGVAGYSTGFKEVPDFGWFGVIGRPLLWLLHQFYDLVGNWGLAIVMLTFLVKLATLYWQTKSIRSMKAMAALGPKMKELQEKYKDDRAKLQQETMGMYKAHGVNPLAGCLPILLQMPIWIALYRMLSSAGELYLEPLVSGWIDDLTAPDPYHVLPIVLITTMFAQARLQPQTQTGMQQKIIMYGIPLIFGIASFFFPSGLSLYIVTNTLLGAGHSIYMNKFDKKGPAMLDKIKGGAGGGGGGGKANETAAKAEGKKPGRGKPAPVIEVEDRSDADGEPSPESGTDDEVDEADDAEPAVAGAVPPGGATAAQQQQRKRSRSRRKRRGRN